MLLPRDYYEASSLQMPVTEPCADTGPPQEKLVRAPVHHQGPLNQEPLVQGFEMGLRVTTAARRSG